MNNTHRLEKTIIVTEDPTAQARGFSLLGREFRLAEPLPRKDEGTFMDGVSFVAEFWVVTKQEYMRVVPEQRGVDFDGDWVYIPTYLAKPSFRPVYLQPLK